jgi:DNA-binding CsgD family transcriptional regulator
MNLTYGMCVARSPFGSFPNLKTFAVPTLRPHGIPTVSSWKRLWIPCVSIPTPWAGLFQHHVAAQFAFTQREQELLELALEGADDASIAKSLFVTLPAIKRRWSNIFERVSSLRPDLCPFDGDRTRGIQKRQRILTYVRSHPEELRPFDLKRQNERS